MGLLDYLLTRSRELLGSSDWFNPAIARHLAIPWKGSGEACRGWCTGIDTVGLGLPSWDNPTDRVPPYLRVTPFHARTQESIVLLGTVLYNGSELLGRFSQVRIASKVDNCKRFLEKD